jgi:hypothetical protein
MNSNIVKGILIALVIIDHNDFSRMLFPGFLLGLSFHVVAFFALPYLREPVPLSQDLVKRHFLRLYYPFLVVALATGTTYWLFTGRPLSEATVSLIQALYNGNAESLKQSTNLYLLWFLPSFFSFVIIKSFLDSTTAALRNTLLAAIVLTHLLIGAVAADVQDYLPLGILPALYILPLAMAAAMIHLHVFTKLRREHAVAASVTLFIAVKWLQIRMGLSQEVGFGLVADYRDMPALLVNDLEAITGTLLVFQAGRFAWSDVLSAAGKFSLQVYLFHAFIAKAIYLMIVNLPFSVYASAAFVFSSVATLFLTVFAARLVTNRQVLRHLMFPAMQGGRERTPANALPPGTG